MSRITENIIEAFDDKLGYDYIHVPNIEHDGQNPKTDRNE